MTFNPHMLPKVRSRKILDATRLMPCEARVSIFYPGHKCSGRDTVVAAHVGNLGKGMSTKVSDLHVCAACMNCHDIIDRRDKRWEYIAMNYPAAFIERIMLGTFATQSRLLEIGVITVDGGVLI